MGFSNQEVISSSTQQQASSTNSTKTNSTKVTSALQCSEGASSNNSIGGGAPLIPQTEEESEPPEGANLLPRSKVGDGSSRSSEEFVNPSSPKDHIFGNGDHVELGPDIHFDSPSFSYMNPKIRCTRSVNGIGLFAVRRIAQDELLLGWAGKVVHVSEVLSMHESERTYILQIDEQLFQVPFWKGYNEPADFVNHSCNPNAGFGHSPISLVAMRDIEIGEEINFDYAMCETVEGLKGNEFECSCGALCCRGAFTGADWKSPKLWAKYGKYFSPHIRKKIKQLKKQQADQFEK